MMLTPQNEILDAAQPYVASAPPPPPPELERTPGGHFFSDMAAASQTEAQKGEAQTRSAFSPFVRDVTEPGFLDRVGANARAAAQRTFEADLTTSDSYAFGNAYEPLVEALNKARPDLPPVVNPYGPRDAFKGTAFAGFDPLWNQMVASGDTVGQYLSDNLAFGAGSGARQRAEDALWQRVADLRANNPGALSDLPQTKGDFIQSVRQNQRTATDYADLLARNSGPVSGGLTQFAAGSLAGLTDPPNIILSAAALPEAETILRTFLYGGTANTAAWLAGLPSNIQRHQAFGEPMSAADIASQGAGNFLFGGLLPAGAKFAGHLLGDLHGQALLDVFNQEHPHATPLPLVEAARAAVEDHTNMAAGNPGPDTPQAVQEHAQRVQATIEALDNGRPDLAATMNDHLNEVWSPPPADEALAAAHEDVALARSKAASEPSIGDAIIALGGVRTKDANGARLPEAGDIEAALKDYKRPGLINNRNGKTADYMREALTERGWMGPGDTGATGINDMLDLMARDAQGQKVFHPESTGAVDRGLRAALDREMAGAGIKASDSHAVAAVKLARFRNSTKADALRLDFTREAASAVLSPDTQKVLDSHGYEPGSDIGAEDELRALAEESRRNRENAGGSENAGRGQSETARHAGEAAGLGEIRGAAGEELSPRSAREELRTQQIQKGAPEHAERLKPFDDPVNKPKAFEQQSRDLARELAPSSEKPGASGKTGDASSENAQTVKPEFGDAQPEIDALRALDKELGGDTEIPNGADLRDGYENPTPSTLKAERREIEREARAVERLRSCVGEH